jgi:hypothetical protein
VLKRWLVRLIIVAAAAAALKLHLARQQRGSDIVTASVAAGPDAPGVLFIGNSHTFVNDLPTVFATLASHRRPVRVRSVAAGGWTLRDHWNDGRAVRAIREQGPWSFVVLQEQSLMPTLSPGRFEDSLEAFDEVVRSVGARTALFELWPARDAGQDEVKLHAEYVAAARKLGLLLVPVGPAWKEALQRHPKLQLYQPDQRHPSELGTALAARVFCKVLLRVPCEAPSGFEGLPRELASTLELVPRLGAQIESLGSDEPAAPAPTKVKPPVNTQGRPTPLMSRPPARSAKQPGPRPL